MNPLEQYPSVRRALYTVQWVANGIAAVLGAYFAASGTAVDALPQWYVVALAVLPVLWTYLGLTAAANTPAPPARDERGQVSPLSILLVVLAVIALLVLVTRV